MTKCLQKKNNATETTLSLGHVYAHLVSKYHAEDIFRNRSYLTQMVTYAVPEILPQLW